MSLPFTSESQGVCHFDCDHHPRNRQLPVQAVAFRHPYGLLCMVTDNILVSVGPRQGRTCTWFFSFSVDPKAFQARLCPSSSFLGSDVKPALSILDRRPSKQIVRLRSSLKYIQQVPYRLEGRHSGSTSMM